MTQIIPKAERKTQSVTFFIEPSLLARLNKFCKSQKATRSEAVRFILNENLPDEPQNLRVNSTTERS